MKKKDPIGLFTVIMFWGLAAFWTIRCVADLYHSQLRGLDPIIAAAWFAAAIKWTRRYLEERRNGEEE